MHVTIAICTWNRAALLDTTLSAMESMVVPTDCTWEVLIIDNNCTDNTQQILDRHEGKLPLRRVKEPKPGVSHARNCGMDNAKGDWILWTDDDVIVDPHWLEEFVAAARRHPEAALIGGPVEPWFPVDPDPDYMAAFPVVRIGYCGIDNGPEERVLNNTEDVFTVNLGVNLHQSRAYRFDVNMGSAHGFEGKGEDIAFLNLVRRAGGTVIWAPKMRLKHYVDPKRLTLQYIKKFYRDNGRVSARGEGQPTGGRHIRGVPTWLLEKCLLHRWRAVKAWLARDRQRHLAEMMVAWHREGMVLGCAAMARAKTPS